MTEQFTVGIVRGSHGVTGEFKVESTSGEYGHFANMEEVTLTDGNVRRDYKIERISEGNNCLYMKLAGISSPEEAQKFNRWQIVVPRSKAHPLKKDEWYIEDLKGCSVVYKETVAGSTAPVAEQTVVGIVTNVLEGGSGYLVEILLSESCIDLTKGAVPGKIVYVPFRNEFIGDIDIVNQTMQLMHLWILE